MQNASPLIVTLQLDEGSFHFFDALRRKHFPPALNFLAAHLTLFHRLPASEPSIQTDLQQWSREQPPLLLQVADVRSIGKGVAYKLESATLLQLHRQMQQRWQAWLTPQDRQKLWPHVTVQNKVSPTEAKETVQQLQATFQPFVAKGLGFSLWSYEDGPWRFLKDYPFQRSLLMPFER